MAAVAPAADQATDLLQKLSLDPKKKTHDASDVTEKPYVNGGNVPSMPIPLSDRSVTPVLQDSVDHSMWYLSTPYYYGGYDGSVNEWEDYPRYVNPDGVEMPPPGVYGDMYHHGYGYAPYGAYPSPTSPVPTMGHDGQLYGTQHYQYPAPYYQSSTPSGAPCPPNQVPSSQAEVSTSAATDQAPLPVDTAKANSNGIPNGNVNKSSVSAPPKPSHQNPLLTSNGSYNRGALPGGHPSSGYQDLRYGFDGMRSPVPWVDGPIYPDGQHRPGTSGSATLTVSHSGNSASARNYNLRPLSHPMGLNTHRPTSAMGPVAPGYLNRMYTNGRMYGQYGSSLRNGLGFGYNSYDSRMSGRWGVGVDSRYKPKGQGNGSYGYGNENLDGLSELNKGPRAGRFKNQKTLAPAITIAVKGQNLPINANNEDSNVVPHMDQYNQADFPEKYPDAKFFVIKSYSEDDIHKSIKYGVWASTPNGNKKLDACYNEAQEKADRCPIFLCFSVNTSGQFVGIAEMVGPVDFNKTVEYWQQDKWNGCFPVKWHIVKDVPNGMLKHITLENNDNKPVTNSRDTQEVKLDQGLQMLQLFKDHISKTSILDDFGFYEARQKAMQEKRAKQQQFQKQVSNVKTSDVNEKNGDGQNAKPTLHKPLEVVSVLKKEVLQGGHGEGRRPGENCLVTLAADVPKAAKQVVEKHIVANGVANGC